MVTLYVPHSPHCRYVTARSGAVAATEGGGPALRSEAADADKGAGEDGEDEAAALPASGLAVAAAPSAAQWVDRVDMLKKPQRAGAPGHVVVHTCAVCRASTAPALETVPSTSPRASPSRASRPSAPPSPRALSVCVRRFHETVRPCVLHRGGL